MNDFIIYGNVNAKGWKVLQTTTSRDRLENILHVIMDSKERALEVLDEIQEFIEKKYYGFVYEMPEK